MVVSCRAVRSPRRRGPQLRGEPRGALLDGVLDRVADAAILAGLGVWALDGHAARVCWR